MKMLFKALLAGLALVFCLSIVPTDAEASYSGYGYVCKAQLFSAKKSAAAQYGTQGYLRLVLNSSPNCGGTTLGGITFFSVGAKSSFLKDANYVYTADELRAMYLSAQQAMVHDHKVYVKGYSGWLQNGYLELHDIAAR